MLTLDELKQAMPAHLKTAATQSFLDKINQIAGDPDIAKEIRDNFVSYTSVLKDGRFKTEDYLNAVTFVSYRIMGKNNKTSYQLTFPDRYTSLVARGATDKDISSFVTAYSKNILVNRIMEQSIVPSWVPNRDAFQSAINVQVSLMNDVNVSPKVRTDAANSIMTHLKKPDNLKVEIDVGVKEVSGMVELKDMLASLAQRQLDLIAQGVTTKEIAHQSIAPMKDITPLP